MSFCVKTKKMARSKKKKKKRFGFDKSLRQMGSSKILKSNLQR